jgi:hypothetical protein
MQVIFTASAQHTVDGILRCTGQDGFLIHEPQANNEYTWPLGTTAAPDSCNLNGADTKS